MNNFRRNALAVSLSALTTLLVSCGGGGSDGGDSGDGFYANNSCSLVKTLSTEKIVNGLVCAESGSPVVELILLDSAGSGYLCTATMLTKQYGVTAAHCLANDVTRAGIKVRGVVTPVVAVKTHPQLSAGQSRIFNDLAVFKLSAPIDTPTVPLMVSRAVQPGEKIYIYGYGQSVPGASGSADIDMLFRGGVMKVESLDEYSIYANYDGEGSNACFGDSGGPAFVIQDGVLSLVGVTSTGSASKNCGKGDINLFANVQAAPGLGFITSYIPGVRTN